MTALAKLVVLLTLLGSSPARASEPALTLELRPAAGPHRTGEPLALEAVVRRPGGGDASGTAVDFEVTEGPGDDENGSGGSTPETPDLSCTTSGDPASATASCTVAYIEQGNEGGDDAVLAWIDADGADATVEADLGEGADELAPGSGGCRPGALGAGGTPEPDASDCATASWTARVADVVDVEPETGTAAVGTGGSLEAIVLDQFGDPFAGSGRTATVNVELLTGSIHDRGDGDDFGSPDLGSCDTGTTGRCTVPTPASGVAGVDRLCAYLPGRSDGCSEAPGTVERDNAADVVERHTDAPAPQEPPVSEPATEALPAEEASPEAPPATEPSAELEAPVLPARPRHDPIRRRQREDRARAEAPPEKPPGPESAERDLPAEPSPSTAAPAARPDVPIEAEEAPVIQETSANPRPGQPIHPPPGPELPVTAPAQPSEPQYEQAPDPPAAVADTAAAARPVQIWIPLGILSVAALLLVGRWRVRSRYAGTSEG